MLRILSFTCPFNITHRLISLSFLIALRTLYRSFLRDLVRENNRDSMLLFNSLVPPFYLWCADSDSLNFKQDQSQQSQLSTSCFFSQCNFSIFCHVMECNWQSHDGTLSSYQQNVAPLTQPLFSHFAILSTIHYCLILLYCSLLNWSYPYPVPFNPCSILNPLEKIIHALSTLSNRLLRKFFKINLCYFFIMCIFFVHSNIFTAIENIKGFPERISNFANSIVQKGRLFAQKPYKNKLMKRCQYHILL